MGEDGEVRKVRQTTRSAALLPFNPILSGFYGETRLQQALS